ncbi:MAG: HAMP domain-containing protein [Candidatus Zixiibacteriota bacterium]|nr:MAG: HAMP domain-containing protein [candidate division Zixibacteria bacterium]
MTFTGRVRWFLVAVAVIPSALIMAVIYFHSSLQLQSSDRQRAYQNLRKYASFAGSMTGDLLTRVSKLVESPGARKTALGVKSGRGGGSELKPRSYGLDYAEILDSELLVLASHHRPGLIGQRIPASLRPKEIDTAGWIETLEYDIRGPHPAFTCIRPIGHDLLLYTGKYLDAATLLQLSFLLDAEVNISLAGDTTEVYSRMDRQTLYESGEDFLAVLAGSDKAGFYLTALFIAGTDKPILQNLLSVAAIVAIGAALLAIVMGIYVTGRTKREIDNLVSATARIAEGDFTTPVMAYEEGEFSDLADSFSDMIRRLRETQKRLAATERIAAWQSMGRKIAHEIKNPLTPIGISADDLRRSHAERLPDFDKILRETTGTIRSEVDRLTKLLDEFVAFARMKPPEIRDVGAAQFIDDLRALYKADIDSGRVHMEDKSSRAAFRFDPDAIKHVLINLIKNGLESSDDARVSVVLTAVKETLEISVEDTGPGFSEQRLRSSFEPEVSTKKGGSGLGLVICHRIVHDHGGTMELYNRSEGGAGVRIALPR